MKDFPENNLAMSASAKDDQDISSSDEASKIPQKSANDTLSTTAPTRRLGIFQLGLFAHEKTAPSNSLQHMTTDAAIRIPHIIPIIAKASEQDSSIKSMYLCHPNIQYITKLKTEGSFCGYRNIQMLISYILSSGGGEKGVEAFADGIPTILRIQDLIEKAWDMGINSDGRIETGGIRGTRKHIGTPEVQALFKSLGIPCRVGRYAPISSGAAGHRGRGGRDAFSSLLDYVEDYFKESSKLNSRDKVHTTNASPIYLQRPHHSLTIAGIELHSNGTRNLLVLDPKARPSRAVLRASEALTAGIMSDKQISVKEFRSGKRDLGLYRQFETLSLEARA